ncbi:MAG: VWA domain-containing protein [Actinomycetia bacterium]|nr:VWA domain-containing protein [Actinomycetes bacterium]
MTLPEVMISVTITGMLVAAMATATSVLLAQADNSQGRINNTRSEQSVGIWMPTDLASAEVVNTDAGASPCGTVCPSNVNVSGSNTLMLSWTGSIPGTTDSIPTQTIVSYRYIQTLDLDWQVIRVACYSVDSAPPTCSQVVVLHDVPAPPTGIEYYAGVTPPVWVMLVTLATDPAAPGDGTGAEGEDPTYYVKNGRRVTVTINGGGDLAGAGGGTDSITLSAGGTNRETELGTTNLSGAPTFAATRSRCGGNFGLVVDTSGSIGSNMSYVRTGVTAFIDAFAGTPIKLQVVTFATTATTLGAGAAWTKYYDMLVESDVTALKALVAGLNSTGGTNWEDGMFRMFRNSNGTVQSTLPKTLIFFTDGIPTYNRFNATSASSAPVAHPDDSGLASSNGSSYSQLAWNRANRVVREFEVDLEKLIGVYVGADTSGQSLWVQQGAGYHLEDYVRGYHYDYQRGSHLGNWERGYHLDYQRGSHLESWQRGYNLTYEVAGTGLTYEAAGSGMVYEVSSTGITYEKKTGSNWNSISKSTYESNNTVADETDNYRARVTGTLGPTWSTTTAALFHKSNQGNDSTDGYRTRVTGTLGSWATITSPSATFYNRSNSVSGSTDGFRARVTGTLGSWTSTTAGLYGLSNTTGDSTDGFRTVTNYSSPYTSWETATESAYNSGNTTPDETDGWRATTVYAAPFTTWTSITQSAYNSGNTTADESDSYRTQNIYTSPFSLWEATTEATYNSSNTTGDESDGWRVATLYTAPFTTWTSITQSAYNSGNTTADESDSYRTQNIYTTPFSLWEATTEAAYNTGNTSSGTTDGWDATKVYAEPFTFHEGSSSYNRPNRDILKQFIAPSGAVPAVQTAGVYTNAAQATYYELPNWTQFSGAMTSMALAECGGTVTLQTKVGTTNASDPFTYQSSVDLTTATTSALYRSGTFDYELSSGTAINVSISPMATSTLDDYNPVGWSCKAGGANYPFTTSPIDTGSPWSKITLSVAPNTAVSCVMTVALK